MVKVLLLFYVLGFTAALVTTATPRQRQLNPNRDSLRFRSDGKFKILMLTDMHYGEKQDKPTGPRNDRRSLALAEKLLAWENPDFVVFTGDLVTADYFSSNGSAYIDMLLQPLVVGGYKWASTYGNHDVGPNMSRVEVLATEQKYGGCYTRRGNPSLVGDTNYWLAIYPAESIPPPAALLWFFDSRGGRNASGRIPNYVDEGVVAWFRAESTRLAEAWGPLPAYAFFHYPTEEWRPVSERLATHPGCVGLADNQVTPQGRNTGLMDALVDSDTVRSVFVGHNHGNAWCCQYRSVEICYNRQSGYGSCCKRWVRGARVVELQIRPEIGRNSNYVRLSTGEIVDSFPKE